MNLIFSSTQLNCLSLNKVLNELVESGKSDVVDKLTYNQNLLCSYILSLLENYPLQGNSFIQTDTLLKVSESDVVDKIQFYDSKESIDNYNTSNMYSHLYNYLKKNGCKKIEILNEEPLFQNNQDNQEAIQLAIDMSGGEIVGEISDAIKKALMVNNVNIKQSDKTDLKQKMANLGMPVEGCSPEPEKDKQPKVEQSKEVKQPKQLKEVKKEPITVEEEEEEICCKIQQGNLVLLIPTGINMNEVTIGGSCFNTLVVKLPDINSSKLQVLEVVKEEKKVEKKSIKPTTEKTTESQEPVDILDLRSQKLELDRLIKEARQRGNMEEVDRLRKERRKVRNKIRNKSRLKDEKSTNH